MTEPFDEPVIEIGGTVSAPVTVTLAQLAALPREERTADFHCVSGWSATGLRWEGVPFAAFYRRIIEPVLMPDVAITHLVFAGLDGFESVVRLSDVLAEDVLIAEHLNGRPLDADHGAPLRLVSPQQYGYISTKHLCRIEVRTCAPTAELQSAHPVSRFLLRGPLVKRHPRARVWEEERHPNLPARWLRPVYRQLIKPGIALCARGSHTASRRDDP